MPVEHAEDRAVVNETAIPGTCDGSHPFDFLSRYFAPAAGIDEDHVTGSAHCCLAPFWSERLGKTQMRAYQASRRGGVVHVRLAGDRVVLAGQAVTVLKGSLRMPYPGRFQHKFMT